MSTTMGERIRQRRIKLKLSQAKLAEKADTTQKSIHEWETDKFDPSAESIVKLAVALKTTTDRILRG